MFDAKQSIFINKDGYPGVDKKGHALIAKGKHASKGWKITNPKSFGRDILRELTDAARTSGLKVGYYYSNPDWTNPDYDVPVRAEYKGGGSQERYIRYMHSQVKQLLTEYGDIHTLWFDGLGGSHPSHWGGVEEYKKLRAISPSTLFNDRFFFSFGGGKSKYAGLEDYYTPERRKGNFDVENKWETCDISVKHHAWSYHKGNPVRSWQSVARDMIDIFDNGGNYLLNIAPDASGELDSEIYSLLEHLGLWMRKHQEGVFNTKAGPFMPGGGLSSSHRGNTVFLHVRPDAIKGYKKLYLPVMKGNPIKRAKVLHGSSVAVKETSKNVELTVGKEFSDDEVMQTIVLEYERPVTGLYKISAAANANPFGIGSDISSLASAEINRPDPVYSPKNGETLLLRPGKWKGEFAVHSATTTNPRLTIELDKMRTIYGLRIHNRPRFKERAEDLTLEYSTDGKTYTKIWQDDSNPTPAVWNVPLERMQTGAMIQGIKAKYLRISLPGAQRVLHLRNVQIFGEK